VSSEDNPRNHPRASPALIAPVLFVLAFTVVIWASAGFGGVVYALIYVLGVMPGLPIGFALFGRAHAAGWVAGILFGYGLLQLTLWAVIAVGVASGTAFLVAWLALAIAAWAVDARWRRVALIALPAWTRADTTALFLTLLLVPALMGPPYVNLGRADAEGNRYYRAYFTADFVWHSALSYELGKFDLPPRNPYMAPRAMNYYWTYFLLPASVASTAPAPLDDVQDCLKSNAILAASAMLAALFLVVRTAVTKPGIAALAVMLAAVAASYEGTHTLIDFQRRGLPYDLLRNMNIDAVTAWLWSGLRVDNMPRSMWYTPQHTTAVALGLVGVFSAIAGGANVRAPGALGAGVALGLATTTNPFLGAAFSAIYGAVVLLDTLVRRSGWRVLARHATAALPVVLAVAWGTLSRMTDGAGSAVTLGFVGFARNRPLQTLLFSLGPILIPAVAGLWPGRSLPWRPVAAAVAGIAIGLVLLYFVRISEASWVGFRAGQILIVSIPILLARTLEFLPAALRWTLVILVLVAGLPTTIIDTYNAQDIDNRRQGPGFRWTLWTTSAQQEAFAWLREHTPDDAIVQMEPMVRGREHWTLIPSFAGRRMAAGLPISLLPLPQYEERSEIVQQMYATPDPRIAWNIAKRFQISYVYVDTAEMSEYPAGMGKFGESRYFERAFENSEVRIYRVR
jgi:hypothetical protein